MSRRLAISSLLNESEHQSASFSTANEVVVPKSGIATDGLHALAHAASMSPTDHVSEQPRKDSRPKKRRHSGTDTEDDVSIIHYISTTPMSMDHLTHHDNQSPRSATSSQSPIFSRPTQQPILSPSQMIQPHTMPMREFVSPTLSAREYGKRIQSRRDPSEERPLPREHQFVLPGADRDHAVIGPGRVSPTTTFRMLSEPSRETLTEDLRVEREIEYRSPESSHSREEVHSPPGARSRRSAKKLTLILSTRAIKQRKSDASNHKEVTKVNPAVFRPAAHWPRSPEPAHNVRRVWPCPSWPGRTAARACDYI
ncbi:hypothetical protein CYLTODRAFT_7918 [Cylindrobasidium torrendii FP15055 ss-10]|uniref:Uncharacterized protein n=1 Tax=Cylindrobasidium torrendii FP15055 ss-10 TaxID=1314674 RepID=A0A0D7BQJ8_9AGAR|nr:hypothetical protein CYLTODRAFT_7918 [Cylindrobasidium torrendii FP15055 ss-10]